MTLGTAKQRWLRVALIAGGLLLLAIGYGLYYNTTGQGLPCLQYQLTGFQCAGCGLTRAIAALTRLDFAAAFTYHALWPLYAAYFLWVGLSDAYVYIRRGELQLLPGKWWMHAAMLVLVTGYGILRNFL